jgi:hypothetical protein
MAISGAESRVQQIYEMSGEEGLVSELRSAMLDGEVRHVTTHSPAVMNRCRCKCRVCEVKCWDEGGRAILLQCASWADPVFLTGSTLASVCDQAAGGPRGSRASIGCDRTGDVDSGLRGSEGARGVGAVGARASAGVSV